MLCVLSLVGSTVRPICYSYGHHVATSLHKDLGGHVSPLARHPKLSRVVSSSMASRKTFTTTKDYDSLWYCQLNLKRTIIKGSNKYLELATLKAAYLGIQQLTTSLLSESGWIVIVVQAYYSLNWDTHQLVLSHF